MKEIGLGKELGDSPQKNVVQFIGCVTSHSKKAILCILSCLLFEICKTTKPKQTVGIFSKNSGKHTTTKESFPSKLKIVQVFKLPF